MQPVNRITDRMRKLGIEQKKFNDALISKVSRVDLAACLKGRAGAQQTDPLQIFVSVLTIGKDIALINIQQRRRRRGTFEKAPNLQKLPALAVAQRRVRNSLEKMHAIDNRRQKFGELRVRRTRRPEPRNLMK